MTSSIKLPVQSAIAELEKLCIPAIPMHKEIWHYTDAAGLRGIVSSGNIFASEIHFLNDSREAYYGHELIKKLLEGLKREPGPFVKYFDRLLSEISNFEHLHGVYVACFCEEGDLLSQWRGYGGGGTGYSVGINPLTFVHAVDEEWPNGFEVQQVIYDRTAQYAAVAKAVEIGTKVIGDCDDVNFERLCTATLSTFSRFLSAFKHPAFSEEREWRLMSRINPKTVQFRPRGNILIPYIELDVTSQQLTNTGKIPLTKIIHGPTLHSDTTKYSVRRLLDESSYLTVMVESSEIPLRI